MMPKLDSFASYDTAEAAFRNSQSYKGIPTPDAQRAAIAELRSRWDAKHPSPNVVKAATDFFGRQQQSVSEYANATGDPYGKITAALMPGSNVQAGIDAAMMVPVAGEAIEGAEGIAKGAEAATKGLAPTARAVGRFATRLAIPALGGPAGGATEGKTVVGAAQGAGEGLIGEGLSGIFQRGKSAIQKTDLGRLGKWIDDNLPASVGGTIKDFDKAFRGGKLERQVGENLGKVNSEIDKQLTESADPEALKPKFGSRRVAYGAPKTDTPFGSEVVDKKPTLPTRVENGMIHVQLPPGVGKVQGLEGDSISASFPEINDKISQVLNLGYDMHGDPSTREAGRALRSAAHQMTNDVADALNAHESGLGDKWMTARQQYATSKVMTRLMREKGVLDMRTGMLDMEKLHDLTAQAGSEGYREDIQRAMGDKADSFINTVFRGAEPVKSDLKGQFPIGRAYAHGTRVGLPVHMPHFARHVGDLPYDLGRGKALSAVLTLGPYKFARLVQQMTTKQPPPPRDPNEIGRRP